MDWTREKLAALSHDNLHVLYLNALRKESDAAANLVKQIEESGLRYDDPHGLRLDSPLGKEMSRIINSPEGVAAAINATKEGLPALAGVDPLLKTGLGRQYETTYESTIQAGYLVTKMMEARGYEKIGQGAFSGGVAKTGLIFCENVSMRLP